MRARNGENRDKYLKIRMFPIELAEVKLKARNAGYSEVSAYVRHILNERQEVDLFKAVTAKAIVEEMRKFGIGLTMLRAQGLSE